MSFVTWHSLGPTAFPYEGYFSPSFQPTKDRPTSYTTSPLQTPKEFNSPQTSDRHLLSTRSHLAHPPDPVQHHTPSHPHQQSSLCQSKISRPSVSRISLSKALRYPPASSSLAMRERGSRSSLDPLSWNQSACLPASKLVFTLSFASNVPRLTFLLIDPFAEADEDTGETKQSQNYIHIRIQRKLVFLWPGLVDGIESGGGGFDNTARAGTGPRRDTWIHADPMITQSAMVVRL